MPSRMQRLAEFLGFGQPDSFDEIPSELFDINSDLIFSPDGSFMYEADPITSLDITDPARVIAEYDFPDLNLSQNIDYSAFNKFTSLASDRKTQYEAYDNMTNDTIISSALEMYADDASQYDNQGRLIWAEGDNPELVEYIDKLLDNLNIGKMLWAIYYNLALYGDVYIRLFKKTNDIYDKEIYPYKNFYDDYSSNYLNENDEKELNENILDIGSKYLPYVELVDEPENVYDLVKNGKTVQYAYVGSTTDSSMSSGQVTLLPPDQFVHIYIENPHIRDRESFEFTVTDENGDTVPYSFKVRRGKSMLHDIYPVEREIQLLENSLLLNRISKSAITRLVQIEVGDMPKGEVRNLTRRLKTNLEAKLSINAQTKDMKNYLSSSGIDNLIVSPTRNGKGGITIENIQADPEVKNLADLDYFTDKRFGGLRIPKAFMGYDETLSANSGGTLAQLDARYGRSVKRLQTCVLAGITDMVNLFLLHDNRIKDVGEFTIRVVSPTTADDLARDENLRNKLGMVSDILNMFDEDSGVDKAALFQHLITNFVGDSRLSDEIYRQRVEKLRQKIEGEDEGEEDGDFSSFGDMEVDSLNGDDEDSPEPESDDESSEEEEPEPDRKIPRPSSPEPSMRRSVSTIGRPSGGDESRPREPSEGTPPVGTSEIGNFV